MIRSLAIGVKSAWLPSFKAVTEISELAPIAQLDRVSAYGAEGCRFEPCWARQISPVITKSCDRAFFGVVSVPLAKGLTQD